MADVHPSIVEGFAGIESGSLAWFCDPRRCAATHPGSSAALRLPPAHAPALMATELHHRDASSDTEWRSAARQLEPVTRGA